jgi:hypothetical protein
VVGDGEHHISSSDCECEARMTCVGKRLSGNLLDGQEHNGLPDWMRV